MPNLEDATVSGHIKAIFKGTPGTGKSCAALTFPKPMYIFDFDGRYRSLLKWAREELKDPSILKGVEYDVYTRSDAKKWQDKINKIELNNSYKTVVLDSMTSLGDILIDYSLSIRGTGSGETRSKKLGVIEMLSIEDFGVESQGLVQLIDLIRTLKCHVILTAHVIETTAKVLGSPDKVERSLLTAGKKIAAKIPTYFDEAYHFSIETGIQAGQGNKNIVRTRHYETASGTLDWAKTSLPIPDKIDITNRRLYDVLKEELKKRSIDI